MSTLGELPKLNSINGIFSDSLVREFTIKNVSFPNLYDLTHMFASAQNLVKIDWENIKFNKEHELILFEFCRRCSSL
jgi:hypothetical protein